MYELPAILAGLLWIWKHPTLKTSILALLQSALLQGKKATGRTGLDLWQILVLGVLRLGLDAHWDGMEHIANYDLPGWRKAKDWRRRLKGLERLTSKVVFSGGAHKTERVQKAVREYLSVGRELSAKLTPSLLHLCHPEVEPKHWEALAYFHGRLDQHLDRVQRRLLQEETIPATQKIFSLFEPHTEWIQKGKQRPNVELGHRLLIATDQHPLIQDYDVPVGGVDVNQSGPVADRLLGPYGAGAIASLSLDKGFTRTEDRDWLSLYIPTVVMPKRAKRAKIARPSRIVRSVRLQPALHPKK